MNEQGLLEGQDLQWLQKFQDSSELEQKLEAVFQIVQDSLSLLRKNILAARAAEQAVNEADVKFQKELTAEFCRVSIANGLSGFSPLFIFLANSKHAVANDLRIALKAQLQIDVMTYPTVDALLQPGSSHMFSVPRPSGVVYPVSLPISMLSCDEGPGDDSGEEDVNMVKGSGAESPPSMTTVNKLNNR